MVGDQDVLRLQVPVVNTNRMTKLDCIQNLQEGMLGEEVVSNESALFGDVGKQIAFWTVLDHHECAVWAVKNLDQGDHIGMLAGKVVELYLSFLEPALSGIQSNFGQGLDGVWLVGEDVNGCVDHPVGADSKDRSELESSCQHTTKPVLWCKTGS